jgi:hypothetical protein
MTTGRDGGTGRAPAARPGDAGGGTAGARQGRRCANPLCACDTVEFTCSLWCGPLDVRQGVRCQCRHESCAGPRARTAGSSRAAADLYPPVLDRFRLERQAEVGGRR